MRNRYLPIAISVKDRKTLVVGGGTVALRKIETLLDFDTEITVIAPEIEDKIGYYAEKKLLELKKREYKTPEAALYGLVISASDKREVNQQVYDDARGAGIPVNVVDNPPLCDFIFPAITKRDCLTVAVATDGRAPFLTGQLRAILEELFPEHWHRIAKHAAEFRLMVSQRWRGQPDKKVAAFERFVGADWKEVLKQKEPGAIQKTLESFLE